MITQVNDWELISIHKAAKMLKLSRKTILELINDGKLGTIHIGCREKIPANELKRFLEENTVRQSILQRRFTSFEQEMNQSIIKDKKPTGFDGVDYIKQILLKEKEDGFNTKTR